MVSNCEYCCLAVPWDFLFVFRGGTVNWLQESAVMAGAVHVLKL